MQNTMSSIKPDSHHIQIDFETVSSQTNAVVFALGAIWHDLYTIHGSFYTLIDMTDQLKYKKRHLDPNVFAWWLDQEEIGKAEFIKAILKQDTKPVAKVLKEFSQFWSLAPSGTTIWSRALSFDVPILKSLYYDYEMQPPWNFRNELCDRTMDKLYPLSDEELLMADPLNGLSKNPVHHAQLDAESQAKKNMIRLRKHLGIDSSPISTTIQETLVTSTVQEGSNL